MAANLVQLEEVIKILNECKNEPYPRTKYDGLEVNNNGSQPITLEDLRAEIAKRYKELEEDDFGIEKKERDFKGTSIVSEDILTRFS